MDIKSCDIVFKIKGKLKEGLQEDLLSFQLITLENSGLLINEKIADVPNATEAFKRVVAITWDNIAKKLLNGDKDHAKIKADLSAAIKKLKNSEVAKSRSMKDILEKGIVGNYKYSDLKYKFYGEKIIWPDLITPYNPDILLVDKFNLNGVNMMDTLHGTDANGNAIYVINNSPGAIDRFIKYLTTRDLILNKYLDTPELEGALKAAAEINKHFNSLLELLLDFLMNNSDYLRLKDGYYGVLSDTIRLLRNDFAPLFKSKLDSEFHHKLSPIKGTYQLLMSKAKFLDIVKNFTPELLEDITSEQLEDPEILTSMFKKLMTYLVEVPGKFLNFNGKNFVILSSFPSIENKYGYNYSTVKNLFVNIGERYKGFNIYRYVDEGGKEWYIRTKEIISPSTRADMYDSLDKVKLLIDSDYRLGKEKMLSFDPYLYKSSQYERVHQLFTNKSYVPGSILNLLDISIDNNTINLDPKEAALFADVLDHGLNDFYQVFRKLLSPEQYDVLVNTIDDIEKAGIFTYLVNEKAGPRAHLRHLLETGVFLEVIDIIKSAKYKLLYVLTGTNTTKGNGSFGTRASRPLGVIQIDSDVLNDAKFNDRPTPIIGLINEVVDTFNERFGIGATLLTLEEIDELFPNEIPPGTKAFIRDGLIYINGTTATSADVIHEYTHLILGVLKAENFDNYRSLIDKMRTSAESDSHIRNTVTKVRKAYPNLAESDFYEEVFAAAFGDFLAGKSASNMFEPIKEEVDQEMKKTIFTLASEEDFNALYRGKVNAVFNLFSKDIGKLGKNLDFSKGVIYRKAANWISKLLDLENGGDLIEKCE